MNYRHIYVLIIEHAKSEEKLGLRNKANGGTLSWNEFQKNVNIIYIAK